MSEQEKLKASLQLRWSNAMQVINTMVDSGTISGLDQLLACTNSTSLKAWIGKDDSRLMFIASMAQLGVSEAVYRINQSEVH